jgi:predicted acylesterase/phospholipase RssA
MTNINNPAHATPQSNWEATVDEAAQSLHAHDVHVPADDPSIAQAANQFSEFFKGQWSKIVQDLGSEHLVGADAEKLGDSALGEIVASTFGAATAQGGQFAKGDLRRTVVSANRLAAENIMATRDRYAATQPVQVVPYRFNGTDKIRFSVIKPAPDIENLVLKGGGAKGIGYGPTLVELENHGVTRGVGQIIGTSAGALTAAFLASGLSAKEFQELSSTTDLASLKGKPPNWSTKYPNMHFGWIGFQGGAAMELVDRVSAQSVKSFLDSDDGQAKLTAAVRDGRISTGDADALQGLRQQNFETDRTHQMVTFQQLECLSKADPGKFKSLTLTGWNNTDKKLTYFNSKDTPQTPIAIAGRISMSIPYFFASPKYDAGQGRKDWVDGGVGSNMPAGPIFDGPERALEQAKAAGDGPAMEAAARALADARSRTMLMSFDEAGDAYKVLHHPPEPAAHGVQTSIVNHLAGNPEWNEATARDREQFHNAGPNGVVVFHGDVGTLSLWAGAEQKQAAGLEAQMRTVEAIAQRQHQASHEVFADPATGASSLSPEERAAFLQAGPPNPQAFANNEGVVDSQLHQAAVQFYEEAAKLMPSFRSS